MDKHTETKGLDMGMKDSKDSTVQNDYGSVFSYHSDPGMMPFLFCFLSFISVKLSLSFVSILLAFSLVSFGPEGIESSEVVLNF